MSGDIKFFVTPFEDLEDEYEERKTQAGNLISFNCQFLDDALIGIAQSEVVLIAGRSGQGKTELSTHIALTNAAAGKKVIYVALEAEKKEISRRMIYKMAVNKYYNLLIKPKNIPHYDDWYFNRNKFLDPYVEMAKEDAKKYDALKIYYRREAFSIRELEGIFATAKQAAELVIVDHLHFFDIDDENENRFFKAAVKSIRDMAAHYRVPVVLVCHVRKKQAGDKSPVPDLEDIHGSSDIAKTCTKAIIVAPSKRIADSPSGLCAETYMRIGKCRLNGSVSFYCAKIDYNISMQKYSSSYELGALSFKGEWERVENEPYWVGRSKVQELPKPEFNHEGKSIC